MEDKKVVASFTKSQMDNLEGYHVVLFTPTKERGNKATIEVLQKQGFSPSPLGKDIYYKEGTLKELGEVQENLCSQWEQGITAKLFFLSKTAWNNAREINPITSK